VAARTVRREIPGPVSHVLPAATPIDWADLLAYLRPRATPGVEEIAGDALRRVIRIGGDAAVLEVRPAAAGTGLEIHLPSAPPRALPGVLERLRLAFDLDADLEAIARELGARDPRLAARLAGGPAPRVPRAYDPFELAVRAILGQQVSVAAATTLAGRLVRAFGAPLAEVSGGLTHAFPSAEALARADVATIGMPRGRGRAIEALAEAVAGGVVRFDGEAEAVAASLVALPGIGRWTADYVAMRALGDPDAFPAGDLGLQRALGLVEKELARAAESWRPWRAYAAMLLWRTG
jgi:3-methyladenine DNA glycosylase/8-oxoguanine DNA glycosylase